MPRNLDEEPSVLPVVRFMIACEDILRDPEHPHKISLVNLINRIRPADQEEYPLIVEEFCVFVQMTECRGRGELHLQMVHADSGELIFRTQSREVQFANQPLSVLGIPFRILEGLFPVPGLYYLELWYNSTCVSQHPLILENPDRETAKIED